MKLNGIFKRAQGFFRSAAGVLVVALIFIPKSINAQDQEDASLFLEEYSDEFQEAFFAALQQKGIRNYDRAIRQLERCLELRPEQPVLYHELARNYFLDKQYSKGLSFAIKAVEMEPSNYWYVETFWRYQSRRGKARPRDIAGELSQTEDGFWSNLAKIYKGRGQFNQALSALERLANPNEVSWLRKEIEQEQAQQERRVQVKAVEVTPSKETESTNPLEGLKKKLRTLQQEGEFDRLYKESSEAVELYPLQPDFYYFQGWALLKNGKPKEATVILEESLAYLLEEGELSMFIYQALAEAYELLGDPEKLKYYQKKLNGRNPQ